MDIADKLAALLNRAADVLEMEVIAPKLVDEIEEALKEYRKEKERYSRRVG